MSGATGVPPPREPVVRRRHSVRQTEDADHRLDDLQRRHTEILNELRGAIEIAIETFSMAMVDYQDGENAGDIDRLVEELDEEITDALRTARREVFW